MTVEQLCKHLKDNYPLDEVVYIVNGVSRGEPISATDIAYDNVRFGKVGSIERTERHVVIYGE